MKTIHSKLVILLMLPIFLGFTGFFKKAEPPPGPQIMGNPDPNVGIIVKFDSTPEMILAESSQNIKFEAINYKEEILSLGTPITDWSLKKFSLIDSDIGFKVDTVVNVQFSFNNRGHTISSIHIWPYPAWDYKPWEEVKRYLDEWSKKLEEAGWHLKTERAKLFKLPSDEHKSTSEVYEIWESEKKDIILVIQPDDYHNDYSKYNLRVSISVD